MAAPWRGLAGNQVCQTAKDARKLFLSSCSSIMRGEVTCFRGGGVSLEGWGLNKGNTVITFPRRGTASAQSLQIQMLGLEEAKNH